MALAALPGARALATLGRSRGRLDPDHRLAADAPRAFYAEITRLRRLVDLAAGPRPLLFLMMRLYGTNSHALGQIGAEAVVRAGATRRDRLVTTARSALTQSPRQSRLGVNVHFEDQLETAGSLLTLMRPRRVSEEQCAGV